MIAPYRGVVIQPLVYRYFSPQSSVKFFSLLNLRIILRPGVQTNRRQSSRPHCCSTVNRDVIICPKDKSRFAVSENLLRRCMAADYDNILKIRDFVIYPCPDQLVYRIFFQCFGFRKFIKPCVYQPLFLAVYRFLSIWTKRFYVFHDLPSFLRRQLSEILNGIGTSR